MAVYRKLYTSFWQDTFVLSLSRDEKLFYVYLMTNDKVSICGIYELPIALACLELGTGFNKEKLMKLIQKFQYDYRKIVYSEKTSEVVIVNWLKYNNNPSPKVQTAITSALEAVKDKELIQYLYGIDTVSIQYGNSIDNNTATVIASNNAFEDVTKEELKDSKEDTKHKYGEYKHVLLKDTEYNRLQDDFGNADELIRFLDEYIEMKGYSAKSHYLAIRKWVVTAVMERKYRDGAMPRHASLEDEIKARAERLEKRLRGESI